MGKFKSICGHDMPESDLHQLCFTCRSRPKKRYPRVHACQTVLLQKGELDKGVTRLCSICVAVPEGIRKQWAPVRSYEGNYRSRSTTGLHLDSLFKLNFYWFLVGVLQAVFV